MSFCFAIFADEATQPTALFDSLEEAMDWATHRFAGQTFRIKYYPMDLMEGTETSSGAGPS